MPRALIAGCGYLGRALAESLAADGWEIEGWTLSPESARELSQNGQRAEAIDLSDARDVAAHKSDFTAVIHCASTRGGDADAYRRVYLEGARNLAEQFRNAKIVFTSSTSVYAQSRGELVTEESIAEPPHESGQILREAENMILARDGVVARLGGIYGPGRSALLRNFLEGRVGAGVDTDRFINQIHRDDAASAIKLLLKSAATAGQIYNIVDNEPISLSACYRWLAARLNRSLPSIARSGSRRKRGESNKRVSNAKLRSLGWTPQYPTFADGMEKSVLPSFSASTV
jgi:nucleoside-diphosphate-sugar epimerase